MDSIIDIARVLQSDSSTPQNAAEQAAKFMSESRIWIILWTLCFILFIMYPILCQQAVRRECMWRMCRWSWRIKYWRWDVSDIEAQVRNHETDYMR